MNPTTCPRCRTVAPAGSSFCAHCGQQFMSQPASPQVWYAPSGHPHPRQPQPATYNPQQNPVQQPPIPNQPTPNYPAMQQPHPAQAPPPQPYPPAPQIPHTQQPYQYNHGKSPKNNKKIILFGGIGIILVLVIASIAIITLNRDVFAEVGLDCRKVDEEKYRESDKIEDIATAWGITSLTSDSYDYIDKEDITKLKNTLDKIPSSAKICFEEGEFDEDKLSSSDTVGEILSKDLFVTTLQQWMLLSVNKADDKLEEKIESFDQICSGNLPGLNSDEKQDLKEAASEGLEEVGLLVVGDEIFMYEETYVGDFDFEDMKNELKDKDIDYETSLDLCN